MLRDPAVSLTVLASDQPRISDESSTAELIAWSIQRFGNQRMVISTSFGMEGCALIDMYARQDVGLEVIYLDTLFFFKETYDLRDHMMERYPRLKFINYGTSITPQQQEDLYGPELWKRNPDLCCKLRKVEPMYGAMRDVDLWITGLRRSQSQRRANLRVMEWDWRYHVLKFSPLADWSRQQIWEYVQTHGIPYNALHDQGYPTVGCTHCTAPVPGAKPGEYSRAGRWQGIEKSECGLHGEGI